MALVSITSDEKCSNCGAPVSPSLRNCVSCQADIGAPNVRASLAQPNVDALQKRAAEARATAMSNGASAEATALEQAVSLRSGVVVSMAVGAARALFETPSGIYVNYERLVASGARVPAQFDNDRARVGVGGILFGSYASNIHYGALSLNNKGLVSYGAAQCRLKAKAIAKRTSFLETNSFSFAESHSLTPQSKLPLGYTADWENRNLIALAKLGPSLAPGQSEDELQAMLLVTDGQDRGKDEFIEAHIYEGFDKYSVEFLTIEFSGKIRQVDKVDARIANQRFKELQ